MGRIQALLGQMRSGTVTNAELRSLWAQVQRELLFLDAYAKTWSRGAVPQGYEEGAAIAVAALALGGIAATYNSKQALHSKSVTLVGGEALVDLREVNQNVRRTSRRVFRATQQTLIREEEINRLVTDRLSDFRLPSISAGCILSRNRHSSN